MQNIDFLKQALSGIEDPRINRTKLHALDNIVILALYGIISGAQGWEEIEEVALQRYDFLATILDLENGIPSHDTFSRLFARIRPQQLMSALTYWANFLGGSLENKVVAIDGKTLRHSFDRASGKSPLHSLSAFVAENSMTLAQCTVDKKENEIKKIPTLLNMIDIKDAIVTIDAIGCQKNIAEHIINLAAIRRIAVSILKARKPPKVTNKRAMFKAAMCVDSQ